MKETLSHSVGVYGYSWRFRERFGTEGFNRFKLIAEINAQITRMGQEKMYVCTAQNSYYSGLLFAAVHQRIKIEEPLTHYPMMHTAHELDMFKRDRAGEIREIKRLNVHSPVGPIYSIDEAGFPIFNGQNKSADLADDELKKLYLALWHLKEAEN